MRLLSSVRGGLFVAAPIVATVVLGASCNAPATTSGDCPDAPSGLELKAIAPYWGGLVLLEYEVSGEPDNVEVDLYDPHLDLWTSQYGELDQRPDGKFVSFVTVNVSEEDKDLDHKLRLRSRLDQCPPSDWVESPSFKLTDPLPGTTWKADLTLQNDGAISIFGNGITVYQGPYSVDPSSEISHTIVFGADGTAQEEFKFTIASETPGDPYDGCVFDLHFVSDYKSELEPYPRAAISHTRPAANATAGSTCNAPSLASMAISMGTFEIGPSYAGLGGINYRELAAKTPGAVRWDASDFASRLQRAVESIAVTSGAGANSVSSNFYFGTATYERQ